MDTVPVSKTEPIINISLINGSNIIQVGSDGSIITPIITIDTKCQKGDVLQILNNIDSSVYQCVPNLSYVTSLLSGGNVTLASSTEINIDEARVLFANYTDSTNPTIQVSTFPAVSSITVPTIASGVVSEIFYASNGTLLFQTLTATTLDNREFVKLASAVHLDSVNILDIDDVGVVRQQNLGYLPLDILEFIGLMKDDLTVSGRSTDLGINITSGRILDLNINSNMDMGNSNILNFQEELQPTMNFVLRDGSINPIANVVDPTQWDNNGSIDTVANGKSTNLRICVFGVNQDEYSLFVQYGQTEYATVADAISGIPTETYVTASFIEDFDICIAVLSIDKGATDTDSADSHITNFGKFGLMIITHLYYSMMVA